MVRFYTAMHPNVEINLIKLMSGELDWIVAGFYSWSDPEERGGEGSHYGYYADRRVEVIYTGKELEDLKNLKNEYEKTDILIVCYERTENTGRFVKYHISSNADYDVNKLDTPLLSARREYVKSMNGGVVQGDFKYDFDCQTENNFPGFKEYVLPLPDKYPPLELKYTKPAATNEKKCIIS